MGNVYVAVDIGASSGRLIAGQIKNDRLMTEEIHRFKNSMVEKDEHFYWDIEYLYQEILTGLKKYSKEYETIASIGIDTWAVDYVLLDDEGQRLAPVYAYRDHRTDGTMAVVFEYVDSKKIYEKTGIQFLQFNSIYQLFEHVHKYPEVMDKASSFLMVPDYLNYLLCGKKAVEFTNATSTQLLNVHEKVWDVELLEAIGIKKNMMTDIIQPGTILGELKEDVKEATGVKDIKVIAPATHDTGSAVVSVPAVGRDFAYISSGTWSLMGIESKVPICTEEARKYNFTNEGGVFGTYRVLKNIMGLWLIQEVKRLYNDQYSFARLVELASLSSPFKCLINPNDSRFLNPKNMIEEIKDYCAKTQQAIPETPGEIARCIFESLAFLYRDVLEQLREIQSQKINRIHIIGGGGQNRMLNQLCADFTYCEVLAGPFEATAIGNLVMQMIALEELKDLSDARKTIKNSFDIESYQPRHTEGIEVNWKNFRRLQDDN